MLFMAIFPAVVLFFGMMHMPESPRWLVVKGKVSAALDVLYRVREEQKLAIAELNGIKDNIDAERQMQRLHLRIYTRLGFAGLYSSESDWRLAISCLALTSLCITALKCLRNLDFRRRQL